MIPKSWIKAALMLEEQLRTSQKNSHPVYKRDTERIINFLRSEKLAGQWYELKCRDYNLDQEWYESRKTYDGVNLCQPDLPIDESHKTRQEKALKRDEALFLFDNDIKSISILSYIDDGKEIWVPDPKFNTTEISHVMVGYLCRNCGQQFDRLFYSARKCMCPNCFSEKPIKELHDIVVRPHPQITKCEWDCLWRRVKRQFKNLAGKCKGIRLRKHSTQKAKWNSLYSKGTSIKTICKRELSSHTEYWNEYYWKYYCKRTKGNTHITAVLRNNKTYKGLRDSSDWKYFSGSGYDAKFEKFVQQSLTKRIREALRRSNLLHESTAEPKAVNP